MNTGDILIQAWKTIWKHKVLWIFGIFAGCGTSSFGSANGSVNYSVESPSQVNNFFSNLDPSLVALLIGLAILVTLIIIIFAIFLSTLGKIGLIRGTFQSYKGADRLTFGELFNGSMPYFWRVFGLVLLIGLLTFVAIFGLIILGVVGTIFTLGIGLLCFIPLLCLLIPATWLLTVFTQQAIIAIVLENLGTKDGLQRGWDVFKTNFGDMLIVGIILFLIYMAIAFILIVPLVAITLPLLPLILSGTSEALRTSLILIGISVICYLPIFVIFNGILQAYITSAWTLNYTRYLPTQSDINEPIPSPI